MSFFGNRYLNCEVTILVFGIIIFYDATRAATPVSFRELFPLIVRHGHGGAGGGFVARCIGGGIGDGVNASGLVGS